MYKTTSLLLGLAGACLCNSGCTLLSDPEFLQSMTTSMQNVTDYRECIRGASTVSGVNACSDQLYRGGANQDAAPIE